MSLGLQFFHQVIDATDGSGGDAANYIALGNIFGNYGPGTDNRIWADGDVGEHDCPVTDKYVVADVYLAYGIYFNAVGLVEHGNRAVVTDDDAGGKVDVVADADVGWVCKDGGGQHTAIVAHCVQVAVAADKLGVFLWSRTAKFDVESPELAVAEGKVTENFLKS